MKKTVKDRATDILKSMGNSGKTVAQFLRDRKIKGERSQCNACPVWSYLMKRFRKSFIEVYGDSILIGRSVIKTPKPIRIFINQFDSGEYKDLEKKEAKRKRHNEQC